MNFSVLIAAHRAEGSLETALASIAGQSHVTWELTVVEYGGHGPAEGVVRDFAGQRAGVRYEHLDGAHTGIAAARNRLLELATGDALAFLEPTDEWLPRHLAIAGQQLTAGADVVVADLRVWDPRTERVISEVAVPAPVGTSPARTLFSRDVIPSPSCVVVRRSTAVGIGTFDTRFSGAESRDFWLRCAAAGARFALTHRVTCRRLAPRPPDATRSLRQAEQATQFYEKHRDLSAVPAALRRRLLAGSLVTLGRLLRPTDPVRAARCFWRAWSLQPVQVQTLGQFALTGPFAPPSPRDEKP